MNMALPTTTTMNIMWSMRAAIRLLIMMCYVMSVNAAISEDGRCSVFTFVPSTLGDNKAFSHMAGALMAMQDFNARNDSLVKELADFVDCNIQFDFNSSRFFGVTSHGHDAIQALYREQETPCAIAGPFHDDPALELSAMATAAEFPMVAHRAFNRRLSSPHTNPYTSLVYPDMRGTVSVLLQVLERRNRTNYINFFYPFADGGFQRRQLLKNAFEAKNMRFHSYSYLVEPETPDDPRTMRTAMAKMKRDGFRTILVAMESPYEELPLLANVAEELQMNNGDYFWVWFGEYEREFHRERTAKDPKNVNITKLLTGSSWVLPFERIYRDDYFFDEWFSKDSSFVDLLNTMNPLTPGQPGYYFAEPDFFQTETPEYGTGFMYDAIMAIGMGACMAQNKTGSAHVEGIHNVDFVGASGRVNILESYTHAREPGHMSWIVFNALPPQDGKPHAKLQYSDLYLVASSERETLQDEQWISTAPFVFANGDTVGPLLRDEADQNYLEKGFRVFGLVLMSIALVAAVAVMLWVFVHRKHAVLRAAQPYFLYLVALGSVCYAITIAFFSVDESYGWSQDELGRACMAVPWLLCMGHIITYGALFSKLWRVNRVLQASRQKVEYHHVVWPFAIMFVCSLIVLVVWTAVDSLEWVRVEDEETGESIGQCESEHIAAFAAPLIALALTASLLTLYMAWKTNDVDHAYSESAQIFILIVVELEMVLIATPVLIILYDISTSGRYVAFSITLWVFAMAQLILIMFPKVKAYREAVSDTNSDRSRVRGGGHGEVKVTGFREKIMKKASSLFASKAKGQMAAEGQQPTAAPECEMNGGRHATETTVPDRSSLTMHVNSSVTAEGFTDNS